MDVLCGIRCTVNSSSVFVCSSSSIQAYLRNTAILYDVTRYETTQHDVIASAVLCV